MCKECTKKDQLIKQMTSVIASQRVELEMLKDIIINRGKYKASLDGIITEIHNISGTLYVTEDGNLRIRD